MTFYAPRSLFFFLFISPPTSSSPIAPPQQPQIFNNPKSCSSVKRNDGIINYFGFHNCIFCWNSLLCIHEL
ncbi:hypothetical protein CDL15_Pgr016341 [Punica granatum]|uniref:Secreted protein n=1 Tax=Punica granatum TaxID=22663 RepID=A0A218W7F1_PUNGR|nr:hypothetical protein CDL15_Pgr016341 [Punica granatum]